MIWRHKLSLSCGKDPSNQDTMMTEQITMQAPPSSRLVCAFGKACSSRKGGKEQGPDLCSWCKNMSLFELYRLADGLGREDHEAVRKLVDAYKKHLEDDLLERLRHKGWLMPCAIKDPYVRHMQWRDSFNPQDDKPCNNVVHRGQLCQRCYTKAREQECTWLKVEFDGDRYGFPCVFEDPRMHRPKDYFWRRGPGEDPDWEKDSRRGHAPCGRCEQRYKLCQNCYARINEMRGFGKFFDETHGILRMRYRGRDTGG
ncbi:hypothetical protein DE146DRAFT_497512 [Phaeosphaeria sp. MPI-PUGE-AT-0046c]|nr:hypothetical protein DE146DRAFT_497512 [Phaeosphaeria sp. MPI-PUGE-AT-0046c]